ncbi:MAG: hypothetical protein LUD16_11435 [Lachnospiraceae bacterium]|nr:hypothetical protein [Lachnospiraceae bacterium]
MILAILKILTDIVWYAAFIAPAIVAVSTPVQVIFLAVPAVWVIYVVLSWKKRDFISDIPGMVLFEARFLLCISLLELIFVGPAKWQALCGRPVLLFLIFGIFLLRAGRIADTSGGKRSFWGSSSISLLAAFCSAAILTSKTVLNSVLWLLRTVYNRLVIPVLEAIFWILARILSAIVSFFLMLFSGAKQEEAQETVLMDLGDSLRLEEMDTSQTPLVAKVIGYVLIGLVALAILYFFYRKLSGNAFGWRNAAHGSITRSNDDKNTKQPRQRGFLWQERNIRYYYKKILYLCAEKGLDTEHPLTSKDVSEFAASSLGKNEESEELTHLYRSIRYGGRTESQEQKDRAKEIYRSWK